MASFLLQVAARGCSFAAAPGSGFAGARGEDGRFFAGEPVPARGATWRIGGYFLNSSGASTVDKWGFDFRAKAIADNPFKLRQVAVPAIGNSRSELIQAGYQSLWCQRRHHRRREKIYIHWWMILEIDLTVTGIHSVDSTGGLGGLD